MKKRKRTKDNIIPFGQTEHVIHLDQRGPAKKGRYLASIGVGVLALCCIAYCLCICFLIGYGTHFFLIWGVIGFLAGILAVLLWRKDIADKIPRVIRQSFWICLAIGIGLFLFVTGLIFGQFSSKADPGADYCIVLGAQWKGDRPSFILQQRLDTAVAYLQQSPETLVIVSGGKGANEVISEAKGMAEYLKNAGIEAARIIEEDASANTSENLLYSSEYLDKVEDSVVIITNNFHMFRSIRIALKKGYARVQGIAAPSYPATMLPNHLLREFLGVVKDFVTGNM